MPSVCLYFKVHQSYRLKQYSSSNGNAKPFEEWPEDADCINAIADECYLPANKLMLQLIKETAGKFKVSFAISGLALSLLEKYRPEVIDSFKTLIATGSVELLGTTYYHSFSYLHSKKEFERQIAKHKALLQQIFGFRPKVFVNTAMIYNNGLAALLKSKGFNAVLCEGSPVLLKGISPNQLYNAVGIDDMTLMLRHASLADDIAFRFDNHQWDQYPLTANKFAQWVHNANDQTNVINLFMDYETFGVYKKADTGIFDFLKALPAEILKSEKYHFNTPSEILTQYKGSDFLDVPHTISWQDKTIENCVWSENIMQNTALKKIYRLEKLVTGLNEEEALDTWGKLQCADYFYLMKNIENGTKNGNPVFTAQQFYRSYLNAVNAFEITLMQKAMSKIKPNYTTDKCLY